jgi:hypothetical protein
LRRAAKLAVVVVAVGSAALLGFEVGRREFVPAETHFEGTCGVEAAVRDD